MATDAKMKCTVKDCAIIRVIDHELNNSRFLYGTVMDDEQGRFSPGDYVFTSLVTGLSPNRVDTMNSTYITIDQCQEVPLTLRAATFLKLTGSVTIDELLRLNQEAKDAESPLDLCDLQGDAK